MTIRIFERRNFKRWGDELRRLFSQGRRTAGRPHGSLTFGRTPRNLRGMRPRFLPLLLGLSVLPLAQLLYPGCATVTGGVTQQVRVKSKPAGARVFLNGKLVGVTPVTAVVSRWGWHRVRIELLGYEPYEVKLEKSYNGNASGNLFLGGGFIVIDALTGAIFSQDVPAAERARLMKYKWERGDPREYEIFGSAPLVFSVELKPAASARKIGQMERRKK